MNEIFVGLVVGGVVGGSFALWSIVGKLQELTNYVGSIAHAIYAVEKAIKKSTDQ